MSESLLNDNTFSEAGSRPREDFPRDWVLILFDGGLRLLAHQIALRSGQKKDELSLDYVFEYGAQMQATATRVTRNEFVIPLDLVGQIPVTVRHFVTYFHIEDLPEWRRSELKKLVEKAFSDNEAYQVHMRTGLEMPSSSTQSPLFSGALGDPIGRR